MNVFRRAFRATFGAPRDGDTKASRRNVRAHQIAEGTPFSLSELACQPRAVNEAVIRSQCYNAYLGETTSLCRVLGRFRMYVDTSDLGLSSHLLTMGYWEMWHTEVIARLVKPGMVAVDIGANLGYFTLLMAELVGPTGRVHAVEPNAAIAERLRRSVYVNGFTSWTTVHELALADKAGEAGLIIPADDPKNGQVVRARNPLSSARIALDRFDAIPGLLEADFIKIDVEGAEEKVWQGMGGLLESGRSLTMVLEFVADRCKDAGAFVDAFERHGFSLAVIDPTDGVLPLDRAGLLARPPNEDQLVVLRR